MDISRDAHMTKIAASKREKLDLLNDRIIAAMQQARQHDEETFRVELMSGLLPRDYEPLLDKYRAVDWAIEISDHWLDFS